ncbi:hypothetical protein Pint_26982 [Pistacia integerrima]|uniref:Uncharacterized protein n=1 Tax=Pistacia integerrima TaxID=434235 RepID=A0ACC0YVE7_9ROSI|nr:hypothetical protein Pint_26982 [Pistacia integerrima]
MADQHTDSPVQKVDQRQPHQKRKLSWWKKFCGCCGGQSTDVNPTRQTSSQARADGGQAHDGPVYYPETEPGHLLLQENNKNWQAHDGPVKQDAETKPGNISGKRQENIRDGQAVDLPLPAAEVGYSGKAFGQQSANDNKTTAKDKSNSGQASGQQSANYNATTAKNKSSSGQPASGQKSAYDNASTAKNKSSSVRASGQQSANDKATSAKNKSSSSGQAFGQPNQKQEHGNGSPGVEEKNKKDKLLGIPVSSDQDLGKKTGGTEPAVHNSSLKGAIRQEDTKKNTKDLNPRKEINSMFEHSSQEQAKGPPLKNEKQKDFGKQPSFKDKDKTNIDSSLPKIVSSPRNPSSEQQKDVPKQGKNIENQINTRTSSPIIAYSSSLGQGGQILSQEQQKSVTKSEGIKKDDKNTVPSHIETKSSM